MVKLLLFVGLLTWAMPVRAEFTYNPEKSADRQLSFWDSNHNGSVELTEYERLATAKFKKIDTDGDDVITHAEMMTHRYAGHGATSRKDETRSVTNLMKRWDVDGDLTISKDEYLRPVRSDFEHLDLDSNQQVSRDELVKHWQKKKQALEQHKAQSKHDDN